MCSIKNCDLENYKNSNECILHSKKSLRDREFNNDFFNALKSHIEVNNLLSNNKIILNDIHFPNYKIEDLGDYTELLKGISNNIEFIDCNFYSEWLSFKEYRCCFNNCNFLNEVNISNMFNLDNTFLFIECEFTKKVDLIGNIFNANLFSNCIFKKGITGNNIKFTNVVFDTIDSFKGKCIFENSFFEKRFIINSRNLKFEKFSINESVFKDKVKIQFCDIEEAVFYNTKFQDLADFYQTKFEKVNFERTDFEKIAVFSETEFDCDVDFKYTKFLGKAIFRDTLITGELNLRDTIFDDEANFLDITSNKKRKRNKKKEFDGEIKEIKVKNRETARVVKSFFDNQNNTIEANRFYALEMKEREKELSWKKDFFEKLVFSFHGISSNHSQDWLLALFWIINLTFVCNFLSYDLICNEVIYKIDRTVVFVSVLLSMYILSSLRKEFKSLLLVLFTIINYFIYQETYLSDNNLQEFSNMINPFSIMTGNDELTFGTLIYKIIIGYLIYQLIISIRQNTRRK